MSTIAVFKTFASGDVLTAADLNSSLSTIINDYNGSISNVNIASNAAIDSTKISGTALVLTGAQTITGNKVITISSGDGLVINNSGSSNGISISQTGVQASSKYALYVYSNANQVNSPLVYLHQDYTDETQPVLEILHDGTGAAMKLTFTRPTGGGISIITNRNDGWNTSGLIFNLVNAGSGFEAAMDFQGSEVVNAAVGGTNTYKLRVAIGAVAYYMPIYTS